MELFKNLLTLALNFPNDLSKCALYCPQHLLMPPNLPLPGLPTVSAGWNAGQNQVELSLHATNASSFAIRAKLVAAADYTVLIEGLEASGDDAIYQYVPPVLGQDVYIVTAHNGTGDGLASTPVTVNAT